MKTLPSFGETVPGEGESPHLDDVAVDAFADAMKAKMARQRAKGYCGWDDPHMCSVDFLKRELVLHTYKGDPVDVANFAMMIWHRTKETK